MQCHDRFSGAAADPHRPVIVALHEAALRRVQENRPFVPRTFERPFEFVDIRQYPEPALSVRMGERIGLNRRPHRKFRCSSDRKFEKRLGGFLWQPFRDLEQ